MTRCHYDTEVFLCKPTTTFATTIAVHSPTTTMATSTTTLSTKVTTTSTLSVKIIGRLLYFDLNFDAQMSTVQQRNVFSESLLDSIESAGLDRSVFVVIDVFSGSVVVHIRGPESSMDALSAAVSADRIFATTADGTSSQALLANPPAITTTIRSATEKQAPAADPGKAESGNTLPIIAGVAIAALFLFAILLILFLRHRRRKQPRQQEDEVMSMPLQDMQASRPGHGTFKKGATNIGEEGTALLVSNPTFIPRKPERQFLLFGKDTYKLIGTYAAAKYSLADCTFRDDCVCGVCQQERLQEAQEAEYAKRDRLEVQLLLSDVERLAEVSVDCDLSDKDMRKEMDELFSDIQELLDHAASKKRGSSAAVVEPVSMAAEQGGVDEETAYMQVLPHCRSPAKTSKTAAGSTLQVASQQSVEASSFGLIQASATRQEHSILPGSRLTSTVDEEDGARLMSLTQLDVVGRLAAARGHGGQYSADLVPSSQPIQIVSATAPSPAAASGTTMACTFLGSCKCPNCI